MSNLFGVGEFMEAASKAASETLQKPCCVCGHTDSFYNIIGVFVAGEESRAICRMCYGEIRKLVERDWFAPKAMISVNPKASRLRANGEPRTHHGLDEFGIK